MLLEDLKLDSIVGHPGEESLRKLIWWLQQQLVLYAAASGSVRTYSYDRPPCSGYMLELYGSRGCVVTYSQSPPYDSARRYWDCWCGKRDDESGGSAMQLHAPLDAIDSCTILQLHRRFLMSGRRKVLRNAEQRRYR